MRSSVKRSLCSCHARCSLLMCFESPSGLSSITCLRFGGRSVSTSAFVRRIMIVLRKSSCSSTRFDAPEKSHPKLVRIGWQ